jgi:uroporphyrinogen decarboxylase
MQPTKPTLTRMENFLLAARGARPERVPVWIMRQAGRYLPGYRKMRERFSFLEVAKTPELAAEVSIEPFQLLDVDAIIVFSDILIIAEAMGQELDISDDGPQLGNLVRDRSSVDGLLAFDPEVQTRFVGDAIRAVRMVVGPDVPVLGFAAAPWTLACYMVEGRTRGELTTIKRMMYEDPTMLASLLDRIASATARYLRMQIAAGASAVQIFDTWAGELSRKDYEACELPATQKLIAEIGAEETPVILFVKNGGHLLSALARTGANVLSLDWRTDLAEARKSLPSGIGLQGNVDPVVLLGPSKGIEEAVRNTIGKTRGIGHILNLGHGILPQTQVANAKAFVQAARKVSEG